MDKEALNDSYEIPNGCQVQDGSLLEDHNVVMTKVDVNAGYWGMYNFYRMQI